MRDLGHDYAPLAPAAALPDPRAWAPALQLAPWATPPQVQRQYACFAREIEAAVLRDLASYRL